MFIHASRRLIGTILGLLAAVAAVWSAFLSWYAGREGTNIRIQDLFSTGITLNSAATFTSLFLPLAFSALLFVVYAVVRWPWLLALGGLICLATAVLWGTRQAQNPLGLHASLVGAGAQLAAGAGVLFLISAVVAPPRRRPERRTTGRPEDTATGYTGEGAYGAGYGDAQAGVGTDAPTGRLTGRRWGQNRQHPADPPADRDQSGN